MEINNSKVSNKAWGSVDKTALKNKLKDSGSKAAIKEAFLFVGDYDKTSTWKFPHHEISGDTLILNKAGVHAAAQRLASSGATATDIPKKGAIAHLRKHYKTLGEDLPESLSKSCQYISKEEALYEAHLLTIMKANDMIDWADEALKEIKKQYKTLPSIKDIHYKYDVKVEDIVNALVNLEDLVIEYFNLDNPDDEDKDDQDDNGIDPQNRHQGERNLMPASSNENTTLETGRKGTTELLATLEALISALKNPTDKGLPEHMQNPEDIQDERVTDPEKIKDSDLVDPHHDKLPPGPIGAAVGQTGENVGYSAENTTPSMNDEDHNDEEENANMPLLPPGPGISNTNIPPALKGPLTEDRQTLPGQNNSQNSEDILETERRVQNVEPYPVNPEMIGNEEPVRGVGTSWDSTGEHYLSESDSNPPDVTPEDVDYGESEEDEDDEESAEDKSGKKPKGKRAKAKKEKEPKTKVDLDQQGTDDSATDDPDPAELDYLGWFDEEEEGGPGSQDADDIEGNTGESDTSTNNVGWFGSVGFFDSKNLKKKLAAKHLNTVAIKKGLSHYKAEDGGMVSSHGSVGFSNFGKQKVEDYYPTDEELGDINANHSLINMSKDQLLVLPIIAADTDIDRGGEHFTQDALDSFVPLYKGKALLLDHDWKTASEVGRIFDAKAADGKLMVKAYIPITKDNQKLISNILAGVHGRASVGFSMDVRNVTCDSCAYTMSLEQKGPPRVNPFSQGTISYAEGVSIFDEDVCPHKPGAMDEYGNKTTVTLHKVADVMELSLVPVPMQPKAGLNRSLAMAKSVVNNLEQAKEQILNSSNIISSRTMEKTQVSDLTAPRHGQGAGEASSPEASAAFDVMGNQTRATDDNLFARSAIKNLHDASETIKGLTDELVASHKAHQEVLAELKAMYEKAQADKDEADEEKEERVKILEQATQALTKALKKQLKAKKRMKKAKKAAQLTSPTHTGAAFAKELVKDFNKSLQQS